MIKICGLDVGYKVKPGEYHGSESRERDSWHIIGKDHYHKTLPEDMIPIYKECSDYIHTRLVFSLEYTRRTLEYCRGKGLDVEALAYYCPEWEDIFGYFECDADLEFLGYDAFSDGCGSIVYETIHFDENMIEWKEKMNRCGLLGWKEKLNQYGLFSNREDASAYAEFYVQQFEAGENLETPGDFFIVEVWRLLE